MTDKDPEKADGQSSVSSTQTEDDLATSPGRGTDWLILFAAVFALVIGLLNAVDANVKSKNVPIKKLGSTKALILLGVTSAAAWMMAQRAAFRVLCLEARPVLKRGVRPSELSDMFELKFPTRTWVRWRFKLWRSSLFTTLCFSLYILVAIFYRIAFAGGSELSHIVIDEHQKLDELICNPPIGPFPALKNNSNQAEPSLASLHMFFNGHAADNNVQTFRSNMKDLIDIMRSWTDYKRLNVPYEKWVWVQGWHSFTLADSVLRPQGESKGNPVRGKIRGPHLIVASLKVTRPADIPPRSQDAGIFAVVRPYSGCGDLPLVCNDDVEGDDSCRFLGIYVTRNSTVVKFDAISKTDMVEEGNSRMECPIKIDKELYEHFVADIMDYEGGQLYMPLLAHIFRNLSAVRDRETLFELNLASELSSDVCRTPLNTLYTGYVDVEVQVEFDRQYQNAATLILIIWGGMLLWASLPSRKLVLNGKVDQWLRFGADLGPSHVPEESPNNGVLQEEARWHLIDRGSRRGGRTLRLAVRRTVEETSTDSDR